MKNYLKMSWPLLLAIFLLGEFYALSKFNSGGSVLNFLIWGPFFALTAAISFALFHKREVPEDSEVLEELTVFSTEDAPPKQETMMIAKIVKCELPFAWYYGHEGEMYEVENSEDNNMYITVLGTNHASPSKQNFTHKGYISKSDCSVTIVEKGSWIDPIKTNADSIPKGALTDLEKEKIAKQEKERKPKK